MYTTQKIELSHFKLLSLPLLLKYVLYRQILQGIHSKFWNNIISCWCLHFCFWKYLHLKINLKENQKFNCISVYLTHNLKANKCEYVFLCFLCRNMQYKFYWNCFTAFSNITKYLFRYYTSPCMLSNVQYNTY